MKEGKLAPQFNLLNQYEFEQTPVWAGINAIGEVVALRPIVENLGLSWPAQLRVIKNDPKFFQLLLSMDAVGSDGKTREMACMKQQDFQDWLWELNPKSENFNVQLWNSYKKGLVVYLLMMLKISLDELQKGNMMSDSFKELRKLNEEKKEMERKLAEVQTEAKKIRADINRTQSQIDEILSRNPNQLILPLA